MPRQPEKPAVQLDDTQIEAFWRDGVICVRQLYGQAWRDHLAIALADMVDGKTGGFARMPMGKDYSEAYGWLTSDGVRDFVLDGPTAWIAQQIFGSPRVNFYYDQVFIKEKLSPNPTPWHHDFTFWPLEGDKILSLWTSLDRVDAASSALEFVAGSHRWPQRFRAIGANGDDFSTAPGLEDLPDIDANRDRYTVLSWDLEPGDALVFHALTLHGARGNSSGETRRRAIATRWCGDDVTFADNGIPLPYRHGLHRGDALDGPLFPRILPEIDEVALAERLRGPLLPDPDLLPQEMQRFSQAKADAV